MGIPNEKFFLEKAEDAYFGNDEGLGQIQQPSEVLEVVEGDEAYAVFLNTAGVLAVYRDAGDGEPVSTDFVPDAFREEDAVS